MKQIVMTVATSRVTSRHFGTRAPLLNNARELRRKYHVVSTNNADGHMSSLNFPRVEWTAWYDMQKRCLNPKHKDFPNYGGRGIRICDRWLGARGFRNFLADMGQRPRGLTLDRSDNNGHYEPSNCRWASRKAQRWNRRDTRLDAVGAPTCKRGHPWTPENIAKNGHKVRCRLCFKLRQRAYREQAAA